MGESPEPVTRWWAALIVLPVVPLVIGALFAPGDVQVRLAFAGTPDRWVGVVAATDATIGDLRVGLVVDLLFALTFAVVGFVLMRIGLRHWAPARRREFGWWHWAPAVAIVAGLLDVIETTGQLVWLDSPTPPTSATYLVAAVSWWKWPAYVVASVGIVGLVIGPAAAPIVRRVMRSIFGNVDRRIGEPTPTEQPAAGGDESEPFGICASGGGIRSSSVMLGAFRGLTADGTFGRARWLHAVSGGGYTAGGWQVSSLARDEVDILGSDHPYFLSVRRRRRYLDNGFGSLVGGVLGAVVRTVAVFGGVLAATVLIGWCLGWLISSWAIHDNFSNLDNDRATTWAELTSWRLLLPGMMPLVAAVVVFVVARTRSDQTFRRGLDRVGVVLAGIGIAMLMVLVAAPIGVRYGRPLLASLVGRTAEINAGFLGVLSMLGVITAVRQLLTSQLKRRWSRLGGFALAFGLLLLAGKVADDRANDARLFAPSWIPIVALLWLVLLEIPPSHRLTLNGVYRKRLATTFCLGPGDTVPLDPIPYCDEPAWAAYRGAPGPELVLCGTSHSTRRQFGGLRSLGFTFRPQGVTLHDGVSAPWATYPSGSWWDGYPRGWIVSRSMALTGAAFASAMGRQSFGSTNALLAAVNLRLGMWVPNPRFPEWFVDHDTSPRVHLGYFVKELFNRYDPGRDAFVYVADGGHRENLGLVEQLREQPTTSIVLDASGDRPGTFSTLRQAIELAAVEIGVEIEVDWGRIEPRPGDGPLDCVTTGTATYPDGSTGRLIYAKAQISEQTPLEIRRFAAANPPFPDYSTSDQFLTEAEFDALVALGDHMAARIASLL